MIPVDVAPPGLWLLSHADDHGLAPVALRFRPLRGVLIGTTIQVVLEYALFDVSLKKLSKA